MQSVDIVLDSDDLINGDVCSELTGESNKYHQIAHRAMQHAQTVGSR